MRVMKIMALTANLLVVAVLLLGVVSMRRLPAHTQGGGAGNVSVGNGDINCDGAINISDASFLLNWLFLGGDEPCAVGRADPALSRPDRVRRH